MGNHSLDNGTLETAAFYRKAWIDHASVKQTGPCGENQMVVNSMHSNYLHINLRLVKPQNTFLIFSRDYFCDFIFLVLGANAFISISQCNNLNILYWYSKSNHTKKLITYLL